MGCMKSRRTWPLQVATLWLAVSIAAAAFAAPPVAARKLDLSVHSSDGVLLAGTLTLPEGEGPFPAVVFTHGSEPGVRSHRGYRRWADEFGQRGFATVVFDKRGNGDSEGEYVEAPDLTIPADDLIAWVDLLSTRGEIRSDSIGVLGWSQGGWVGPLAASRSEKIAWVVSISGPGVSPLEQNIYDKSNQFRATGATEKEVAAFSDMIRLVWTYIATGENEAEAQRSWDEARKEAWFERYNGPPMMDRGQLLRDPRMTYYAVHMRYEPVPVLASLEVPMLAVFGDDDHIVPIEKSIEAMKSAFDSSGHGSLLSVLVIPGGDHGLRVTTAAGERELSSTVIEDIIDWVQNLPSKTATSKPFTKLMEAGLADTRRDEFQIEFEHTFGGSGRDTGNGVIELCGGGYAFVGYVEEEGTGKQVALGRIDEEGGFLWLRTWGGPGEDWGWDLRETDDGGFLIVGFTSGTEKGDEDLFLARTDDSGELLWERRYGGEKDEEAWALELLRDGGAILVAQTESDGAGREDVYLVRTDAEGAVVWSRTVGGPGTDRVFAITPTADGRFAVTGISQETADAPIDVYVLSFDEDGEVAWQKRYGGRARDVGHGIAALPDGDLLVTGYGASWANESNDIYLLKLRPDGEIRWRRTFGGPADERAMMSGVAHDGRIVVVGYVDQGVGPDPLLIGLNSEGTVLWKKTWVRPGPDRGVMVQPSRDGGWILTGGFASADDDSFDLEILKFRVGD